MLGRERVGAEEMKLRKKKNTRPLRIFGPSSFASTVLTTSLPKKFAVPRNLPKQKGKKTKNRNKNVDGTKGGTIT